MFYKKGIHIGRGHEREMFEFLQGHFRYDTLNGWNKLTSIANNVKVYKLGLPYLTDEILDALECAGSGPINAAIGRWEAEHPGYMIGFNGRSDGYIVLYNRDNYKDVAEIVDRYNTYEDFKEEYSYIDRNWLLKDLVNLVRDFDKLCDELRVITAYLTKMYIKGEITNPMEYECIPKDFRKRIENS